MTNANEDPFKRQMEYSAFARFRDLLMPAYLLSEQMGMTAGLAHMASDLHHDGMLTDGPGTRLDERPLSQAFNTYVRKSIQT